MDLVAVQLAGWSKWWWTLSSARLRILEACLGLPARMRASFSASRRSWEAPWKLYFPLFLPSAARPARRMSSSASRASGLAFLRPLLILQTPSLLAPGMMLTLLTLRPVMMAMTAWPASWKAVWVSWSECSEGGMGVGDGGYGRDFRLLI